MFQNAIVALNVCSGDMNQHIHSNVKVVSLQIILIIVTQMEATVMERIVQVIARRAVMKHVDKRKVVMF